MDIFKKLGWFFKQEWKSYSIGIVILFFISVLGTIVPLIIARIIDSMEARTMTRETLIIWVFVLLAVAVLNYLLRYFWRRFIFGSAAKLDKLLRQRLFNHFIRMDTVFFQEYRTGDLMTHATQDVSTVANVAGSGVLTMFDSVFQGVMTLLMMFFAVDWKLSLVAILPLPLLALLIQFNGKKVHFYFKKAQESFSKMNEKVQESITGVKVIKAFGEEDLDVEDFEVRTDEVVEHNRQAYLFESFFMPSIQTVMGLSTVISIFYGGYLVSQGQLSLGLLIAFLNYVSRMGWPMVAVGNLYNLVERGSVSYNRIEAILKVESNAISLPNTVNEKPQGDLKIKIDEFIYPGDQGSSLHHVEIVLKQGQTLGIVGKTGSGKSTLFKLLLRDFDHYEGKISFGDHAIVEYDTQQWLGNIGYVPQENFLFSVSVRDNIRFAVPNASQEQVEEVAKLTHVHEDILGFPEGYETLVGERGVALSGGQKQRISMARALIIDPELLILDDSLSAVDAKTEEAIVRALKEERRDKTTIISAHRLSSVMHADEIIVMDNGTISERGTHESLLGQNGWYKEMFERQQLEDEMREEEEV